MYISLKNITKSFDGDRIKALRGVDLEIEKGEFIAIMGPSGCGKSTLLNVIGALDTPDSGQVVIDDIILTDYKELAAFRSKTIGYIFQLHNLIPSLTALENVQVPMIESKMKSKERVKKSEELLSAVGLEGRSDSLPTKLSGGERQRVAIARALANDPHIIIADEPTGSLDSTSALKVMELLSDITRKSGKTTIMVTHDQKTAGYADRLVNMLDGKIL